LNREGVLKEIERLECYAKEAKVDLSDIENKSDEELFEILLKLAKVEEENIETGIDWDYVKQEIEKMEPYEPEPGVKVKSLFIGTVFNLTPSGKYYTFWACSNLEPCPVCDGKGCEYCGDLGSREAYLDQIFWEKLEKEAEEHGFYVTSSEGDPCDILVEVMAE